jgi:ABC-type transporter Mla subunit MlaD
VKERAARRLLVGLLWGLVVLVVGAIMFALVYFGRQSL